MIGEEGFDWLSQELFLGILEKLSRGTVHPLDPAIGAGHHQAIDHGFQDLVDVVLGNGLGTQILGHLIQRPREERDFGLSIGSYAKSEISASDLRRGSGQIQDRSRDYPLQPRRHHESENRRACEHRREESRALPDACREPLELRYHTEGTHLGTFESDGLENEQMISFEAVTARLGAVGRELGRRLVATILGE